MKSSIWVRCWIFAISAALISFASETYAAPKDGAAKIKKKKSLIALTELSGKIGDFDFSSRGYNIAAVDAPCEGYVDRELDQKQAHGGWRVYEENAEIPDACKAALLQYALENFGDEPKIAKPRFLTIKAKVEPPGYLNDEQISCLALFRNSLDTGLEKSPRAVAHLQSRGIEGFIFQIAGARDANGTYLTVNSNKAPNADIVLPSPAGPKTVTVTMDTVGTCRGPDISKFFRTLENLASMQGIKSGPSGGGGPAAPPAK